MRIHLVFLAALIVITLGTPAATAQDSTGRVDVRVAAGVTYAQSIFGDDSPRLSRRHIGLAIGGQIRGQVRRRTGLALDALFDTKSLRNPHFDERFRAVYVQVGPEIGRRTYVRPTAGVAIQSWSGTRSCGCLGTAFSMGLAVGRHVMAGAKYRVSPEFVARASYTHEVATWLAGVQVPVGTQKPKT